jgi:hypothetical protein
MDSSQRPATEGSNRIAAATPGASISAVAGSRGTVCDTVPTSTAGPLQTGTMARIEVRVAAVRQDLMVSPAPAY